MARTRKRAKLAPDLLGTRSARSAAGPRKISLTDHDSSQGLVTGSAFPIAASPATESNARHVLFEKGTATALAFKPLHWSYEATTESEGPRLSPDSASTKETEAQPTPSSTPAAVETTNAVAPTPAAGHARTLDTRAAQQALTTDLAEMIDSILRTRRFATRGIHESFRKRPVTPVLPVEQVATSQDIASALQAELARAKAIPEAEARLKRPVIDLVLGFLGLRENAPVVANSEPVRD